MRTHAFLVASMVAALAFGGGCCAGPCGLRCCDDGGCGPGYGCGGGCGLFRGPGPGLDARADACGGPCGDACGGPCDDGCGGCGEACGGPCGACRRHCGPLTFVFDLLGMGCGFCGESCGERYWGEPSDPPACHDPCDGCGNWTGGGCNCGGPAAEGMYADEGYGDAPVTARGKYPIVARTRMVTQSDRVVTPTPATAAAPGAPVRSAARQAPRQLPSTVRR